MRVTRSYVDLPLAPGVHLALPEEASSHLLRVLRLRVGDRCMLFNGDGHDYEVVLTKADKRGGVVEVMERRVVETESPLRITLVQGIARGEKMDLILQKATELGVAAIVPVDAERTEVRLDGARLAKRLAHWRGVVSSACGQCGRARLPALAEPLDIARIADAVPDAGLRLTLDPQGDHALTTLSDAAHAAGGHVALAIGPEGGWAPRDREHLRAAGLDGWRRGPRSLRTEPAGRGAVAALLAVYGDLRA